MAEWSKAVDLSQSLGFPFVGIPQGTCVNSTGEIRASSNLVDSKEERNVDTIFIFRFFLVCRDTLYMGVNCPNASLGTY